MKHSYKAGEKGRLDIANELRRAAGRSPERPQFSGQRLSAGRISQQHLVFGRDRAKSGRAGDSHNTFENGPNGPLLQEVADHFKGDDGKYTCGYVPRPGNINAWDLEEFRAAVKATGKKQLVIAGVVTEVCVAFPTLSALSEGYEVFVVADASGTMSQAIRVAALRTSAWCATALK